MEVEAELSIIATLLKGLEEIQTGIVTLTDEIQKRLDEIQGEITPKGEQNGKVL